MKTLLILSFLFVSITNLVGGTRFYRASYRDDPSTTIVIGWCDDGVSTNAQVYFDTIDYGTTYSSYANTHSIDRTQTSYSLNHNFARLTGLIPNTIYFFVVRDDEGCSSRMYFKTLPDDPDVGVSFIAGADSRTGSTSEAGYEFCRPNRQKCDSLVGKIRPDFVTFNGDFVATGTTQNWIDWFSDWQFTLGTEGRLIPIIPVHGNHEASMDLYNIFDVPNTNEFFSLKIGGNLLRIYSLNSSLLACDTIQRTWLLNDLILHTGNSNEPYWKFAQYHIPFVPHANYYPNTILSDCWVSIFQQYGVKLVSEAHSHVLKTTWPIVKSSAAGSDNGFIRDDANGIVYIGEGSWGAPQRNLYTYFSETQAYNWTRNQIKMSGFQMVSVTKQRIEVRTILSENVNLVGQVHMNDPLGTLPANLSVWNPSNGSVVTINYQGTLGIDNPYFNTDEQKLVAFPIPAVDKLTFHFEKLIENAQIEIYNGFGAKLITVPVAAGIESLDFNFKDMPEGTYFAFLISKSGVKSCKIIHLK